MKNIKSLAIVGLVILGLFLVAMADKAAIDYLSSVADAHDRIESQLSEAVAALLGENRQLREANQALVDHLKHCDPSEEIPSVYDTASTEATKLLDELQQREKNSWIRGLWLLLGGQVILAGGGIILAIAYSKKLALVEFLEDELTDLKDAKRRDERRIKELLAVLRNYTAT